MPYVIDGYNLLRTVENIGHSNELITDVGLCRMIVEYLRRMGQTGQIVFDGIGPPDKSGFSNLTNLEVIFSGRSQDADSVIENKIAINTAPKRLVVVSSDRRLRSAARRRKAIATKSEHFWQELVSVLGQKRSGPVEPTGKRQGITESETQRWLKTFGIPED